MKKNSKNKIYQLKNSWKKTINIILKTNELKKIIEKEIDDNIKGLEKNIEDLITKEKEQKKKMSQKKNHKIKSQK